MILLTEKIGSGLERDVYLHPHDDRFLVKIPKLPKNIVNDLECEYYTSRIKNSAASSYFAEVFGWEDTNLGRGLLVECIRDNDGRISRTLGELVNEKEIFYSDAKEKIEFVAKLSKKNGIIIRELQPNNIVARRNKIRNEFDIVIVDGLGPVEINLINFLQLHFDFLSRAKARRIWNRQIKMMEEKMGI